MASVHQASAIQDASPKVADQDPSQRWSRPASPPPEVPTRHRLYYLDDGNVVFMVETYLFRLHRYFLVRESTVFKDMFTLPQANGSREGESDEEPIKLEGVTAKEMESLLNYLYNNIHGDRRVSREEWKALLSISSHFDFERVRARCIAVIQDLDPPLPAMERIVLGQKHSISGWLFPAYEDLVRRTEPLTVPEARQLGVDTTALLAMARERARMQNAIGQPRPSTKASTPLPLMLNFNPVLRIVHQVFDPDHNEEPKFVGITGMMR